MKFARLKQHSDVIPAGEGGNALAVDVQLDQPVFEPAEPGQLLHTLLDIISRHGSAQNLEATVCKVILEVDRWEVLDGPGDKGSLQSHHV